MEPISFVTQRQSTASSDNGLSSLSDNFDSFLSLLTAQLQNQDPLSPADASEFTNQLVQFSQVEQQIKTNSQLDDLIAADKYGTGAAMSSYLGNEIELDKDQAGFDGDDLVFTYDLAEDAATLTVMIYDDSDKLVWSEQLASTDSGKHEYSWDGRLSDGGTASEGAYRFAVRAGDSAGAAIESSTGVKTRVTGIDFSGASPAIITESGIYGYADIARLFDPA